MKECRDLTKNLMEKGNLIKNWEMDSATKLDMTRINDRKDEN